MDVSIFLFWELKKEKLKMHRAARIWANWWLGFLIYMGMVV